MTATGPGQDVGVEALDAFFARTPRLAVAFSGGCDSSFLLVAALRAGCDVKAYGVRTAFQPAFEIDDAKRLAAELGADFELVDADVLAQGEICANGPDRCYRCKTFIFHHPRGRRGRLRGAGRRHERHGRSGELAPASRRSPSWAWCRRCAARA
ncbi:MAG: 7-cyano-7-deazaguanine synthase [Eggerthella lenta]